MIFTVATIWPLLDGRIFGDGRDGDRRIDRVDGVDQRLSTVKTPAARACILTRPVAAGFALDAARSCCPRRCASAASFSSRSSGVEDRGNDFGDAGLLQRGDVGTRDSTMRLAKAPVPGRRRRAPGSRRRHRRSRPARTSRRLALLAAAGAARAQRADDLAPARRRRSRPGSPRRCPCRSAHGCARSAQPSRPAPAAARRAWHASCGCPARRHRSSRPRAPPSARNRRSSDRGSPPPAPCSRRAAAPSARPPAIRHAAARRETARAWRMRSSDR